MPDSETPEPLEAHQPEAPPIFYLPFTIDPDGTRRPYPIPGRHEDGTITWSSVLNREELLCLVHDTMRQPKPGARGPKPTPWTITYQRLQQMRHAREAIRTKGEEVTKPGLLEQMGQRGDRSTVDRWLHAVPISWEKFLAEGINATGTPETLGGQGAASKN